MSKKNDDFFKEKKIWSEVKDELLGCYLKPYVQKIMHTKHPIVYIDCFAGKGRFEDGKPGSPIIALGVMKKCIENTKLQDFKGIETTLIDVNYAEDLKYNLKHYNEVNFAKVPLGTIAALR